MNYRWSQDDVFPLIAQAIETLSARQSDFVSHDAIASYLLSNPEAATFIDQAYDLNDSNQSREWIAHNMVAWFSQRITVGDSNWSDQFERQKIDDKWAYRPVLQSPME